MKVYNYTNIPVYYRDDPIPDNVNPIIIDRINYGHWTHNGQKINNDGEHDKLYIMPHWNDNYQYDYTATDIPDVWLWVSIFLTFFGFYFVTRILQKIKLS